MPQSILIATLLRPDGDTGVQTHVRAFQTWAQGKALPVTLVTPYNCPRWQVYPAFGLRRIIDPMHKSASVWWYRHWHALFLRRALRVALADGHPCTIYAQCPLSAAVALRARANQNQKVAMVVHFNISQAEEWVGKGMIREGGALYCAIRKFEADVLPRIDGLVFVSDYMRLEVAARIPATSKVPFCVVPNFVLDPGLPVNPKPRENDLICIGTLEPRKNQRYALAIVTAAVKLGRPIRLTIVGDGPDRTMLETVALENGIAAHVDFAGLVRNAAGLIPDHSACLHVAQIENLPLTLIEALSRGVPVFAPSVGGVTEVFADGLEGRLIPLDDAESAAKKIIEWLDSPQAMETARLAARERFLARFEAGKVAADLVNFLNNLSESALTHLGQPLKNAAV